ncbi:hypothetical protein O6H91_04G020400 [Diphasiastrum complanatum]|uniref:Uncharacterized protein n=2 Tax=Diphasiastrum complanatum TaxID=34168 RepID=A0ACC2D5Z5_DIPCM|nr:hypothetical protein O6H91_07G064900 [Diphasiastrum complanatum]KAJ7557992.1 hypothetical protein O6H91_04G020400 [Diphasiastrum complanatum]
MIHSFKKHRSSMAAVVSIGGENFSSENNFVGFEETGFVWAGSLQRTSSMSEDDSPTSPLSDITHLSCFNIMGSAAAMEPSFGSAITLDSLSWNDGRRGMQP